MAAEDIVSVSGCGVERLAGWELESFLQVRRLASHASLGVGVGSFREIERRRHVYVVGQNARSQA